MEVTLTKVVQGQCDHQESIEALKVEISELKEQVGILSKAEDMEAGKIAETTRTL